jgi:hypothetical protein
MHHPAIVDMPFTRRSRRRSYSSLGDRDWKAQVTVVHSCARRPASFTDTSLHPGAEGLAFTAYGHNRVEGVENA